VELISKGALYLVSTPIGNLDDISYRAVRILSSVDLIAAEDTRKSSILLKHYGISTPTRSYHSYNLRSQTPKLIEIMKKGSAVAVISDAGTPGISDPGYQLVRHAINEQIKIIPIPGASAFITALSASGLSTNRFIFEGFLPTKKGRKTRLNNLANEKRTMVFYESPHRIHKTVIQIKEHWGDRRCVLARELTKKFEEFFRGTLIELDMYLQSKNIKGEIVLIIEGKKDRSDEK
jgi:16S rRNA (cytidine1402-2'-O)-methyltransferase